MFDILKAFFWSSCEGWFV